MKELKCNFDKIIIITKPGLDDILWWKLNIPSSFAPVREIPVTVNTDASYFGFGACTENGQTGGGQFNLEETERELHINILE